MGDVVPFPRHRIRDRDIITSISVAYDEACRIYGDMPSPTPVVQRRIVEQIVMSVSKGERDPGRLVKAAIGAALRAKTARGHRVF